MEPCRCSWLSRIKLLFQKRSLSISYTYVTTTKQKTCMLYVKFCNTIYGKVSYYRSYEFSTSILENHQKKTAKRGVFYTWLLPSSCLSLLFTIHSFLYLALTPYMRTFLCLMINSYLLLTHYRSSTCTRRPCRRSSTRSRRPRRTTSWCGRQRARPTASNVRGSCGGSPGRGSAVPSAASSATRSARICSTPIAYNVSTHF